MLVATTRSQAGTTTPGTSRPTPSGTATSASSTTIRTIRTPTSRKAIHDLTATNEPELLACQALQIAIVLAQALQARAELLVLSQHRGDPTIERVLLPAHRAQMNHAAAPEEQGREQGRCDDGDGADDHPVSYRVRRARGPQHARAWYTSAVRAHKPTGGLGRPA
jgi:hypothetical protein